ncbi:MAG: PQQ-binding-like beta-propeller repeat protein [Lacipirellulaceae bacterium]
MIRRTALLSLLFLATIAPADDWPQWLGPNRDGLSTETGLLQEWPAEGPKSLWVSRSVGLGYSGPAVVGDRLYLMGTKGDAEALFCLDTASGDELWSTPLGDVYDNNWGDGPRGTPTVEGGRVYALAAKGTLACIDAKTGEAVWTKSLVDDLGGEVPHWGYSESPLIDGQLVVVTPGGDDGTIAALDKESGDVVWRSTALEDGAHYSSVVAATIHGKLQYVQLLEKRLVGLDPQSGNLLWEAPWPGSVAVIPTPIARDNRVYVTSGYGAGSMLVEVDAANKATVVYDNKVMKNHHGGVMLLGDHLYGHSDGVGWVCQDFATGKQVWRERSKLGKGAVAYADGRLYCLDEEDGEVVLAEPTTEGWREHGRFKLDPQTERRKPSGRIWTHPVIANGVLYLRDQELLQAFDVSVE